MAVADSWSRIEQWLKQNAPKTAACLQPGASAIDIGEVERQFPFGWPADLRQLYLLVDGAPTDQLSAGVVPGWDLQPLESISTIRAMYAEHPRTNPDADSEPAGETANDFVPAFVPIGDDYTGGTLVVDCRPGPQSGCVTEFLREDADTNGPSWPSVAAMLDEIADALEHGRICNDYRPVVVDGLLTWEPDDGSPAPAAVTPTAAVAAPPPPPPLELPTTEPPPVAPPPPPLELPTTEPPPVAEAPPVPLALAAAPLPEADRPEPSDDPAAAANARIRADLAGGPGTRPLTSRFGTVRVEATVDRPAPRMWDLIANLDITRWSQRDPLAVGGKFTLRTDDPAVDGFVGDDGEIACRWTTLDRPEKVVVDWTWLRVVAPNAARVPRVSFDAELSVTIDDLSTDPSQPRCRINLVHGGVPRDWVADMTAIWTSKIDVWVGQSGEGAGSADL